MKIAIFVPYGGFSKESGLMHLLANYINTITNDVLQLRCNGVFSLCDRDEESGWQRKLNSCLSCMANQTNLADWSGVSLSDLSRFITPAEIVSTRRWIHSLPTNVLNQLNFRGINLFELSSESLQQRLGVATPDLANKKHEQVTRRMLLSAARMCLATKRFQQQAAPTISLVAGGHDFITRSFAEQSRKQNSDIAVFEMDINERCVKIRHPRTNKLFACELLITDISHMRSDCKTWPREIIGVLDNILAFLEISQAQIALPLAR